MPDYVITPPAQVGIPVAGGGSFPVRRVYCVGRNYAEHVREMGHDPNEAPPFFFAKPADALVTGGAPMPYPTETADLHHEIEFVAAIGTGGKDIPAEQALSHVWGYAVGLDMTRRDYQSWAKKHGRPWEMAKSFDYSGPIGELIPAAQAASTTKAAISLKVNGEARQQGDLDEMIWDLPHVIAHLSHWVELQPGDLIFTGTPAGVGPVVRGDVIEGEIAGIGTVRTTIV